MRNPRWTEIVIMLLQKEIDSLFFMMLHFHRKPVNVLSTAKMESPASRRHFGSTWIVLFEKTLHILMARRIQYERQIKTFLCH